MIIIPNSANVGIIIDFKSLFNNKCIICKGYFCFLLKQLTYYA